MVEQIFALLSAQPLVSIVLGFALAGLLAVILKDEIRAWVKKKYNLYSEEEIQVALEKSKEDNALYAKASEKLTPSIETRIFKYLKNPDAGKSI